jgi:hypothetical protein
MTVLPEPADTADAALQLLAEGLQCLRSADTAHSAARKGNAVATHDGDQLTALPAAIYGDQMQRAGIGYLIAALVHTQLDAAEPEIRIVDTEDLFADAETVSTGDMFMDDVIQSLIHQHPEWGENDRAKVWDNGRKFVARHGQQAQTVAQEYWGL